MTRRRQTKQKDRLGIAMLLGALVGFAIGGVTGLSSTALDAPVLMPFAGAAIGVLVAAVIVGVISMGSAREQAARRAREGARAPPRTRAGGPVSVLGRARGCVMRPTMAGSTASTSPRRRARRRCPPRAGARRA